MQNIDVQTKQKQSVRLRLKFTNKLKELSRRLNLAKKKINVFSLELKI